MPPVVIPSLVFGPDRRSGSGGTRRSSAEQTEISQAGDVAQSNPNGASADKVMAWAPTGIPRGTPRCRSRNALVDVKKRPHAVFASD